MHIGSGHYAFPLHFIDQKKMIQPIEPLEVINQRLIDYFGLYEDRPAWRLVFSEDQLEKRLGTFNEYTPDGFFIRQVTEVRLVPKYRQWIHKKWVLERLTAVPQFQQDELLVPLSYEPIWVFEDKKGNPLPPIWLAIEFIIQHVYGVQGKKQAPMVDPNADYETRIENLQKFLFGNESDISDALAYKEAIVNPYQSDKGRENGDRITSLDERKSENDSRTFEST
jgi:hypothetical protein